MEFVLEITVLETEIYFMPKNKTHKGLRKRVKITANGKLKHKSAFTGHLMSSKNAKRRRNLAKAKTMDETFAKTAKSKM